MRAALFLAVVALGVVVATGKSAIAPHFVNENCHRQIEVGVLVRDKRAIAVQPHSATPPPASGADYFFNIETFPAWAPNMTLASLVVKLKGVDAPLDATRVSTMADGERYAPWVSGLTRCRAVELYKVHLDRPLERNVLSVDATFSHAQRPIPREIRQNERQLMFFKANAYVASPYETTKQKLKVTFVFYTRPWQNVDASDFPRARRNPIRRHRNPSQSLASQSPMARTMRNRRIPMRIWRCTMKTICQF
jgi:hypothetical protein